MSKTVVAGMSGGVDSAVAALLCKQAGYNVVGLFMNNWEEEPDSASACRADEDFADVVSVCGAIGIPYYSVDFSKEYLDGVFKHFLREYAAGRTPNPDVLCNREIKFGRFAEYAAGLGADLTATGHYAAVEKSGGGTRLKKPADTDKDQTYFLNQVSDKRLKNVLFPLAGLKKNEVRKIAEENGFTVAKKKDSTGICFIGERRFKRFLQNYFPIAEGKIIDTAGREVGRHEGLMYYTLGQRRGLNIGGQRNADRGDGKGCGGKSCDCGNGGKSGDCGSVGADCGADCGAENGRWYVVGKDLKRNELIVSRGGGEELYRSSLLTGAVNWISFVPPDGAFKCKAKFRYRQSEQGVTVTANKDGSAAVEFDAPQRAVTEGQYAVFYDGEYCLGGGVIEKTYKANGGKHE